MRRRAMARPPISRGGAIIHEVGTVRMGVRDYDARVAIPEPTELAALGHALARIASGARLAI